jgi:hypothetical protein
MTGATGLEPATSGATGLPAVLAEPRKDARTCMNTGDCGIPARGPSHGENEIASGRLVHGGDRSMTGGARAPLSSLARPAWTSSLAACGAGEFRHIASTRAGNYDCPECIGIELAILVILQGAVDLRCCEYRHSA